MMLTKTQSDESISYAFLPSDVKKRMSLVEKVQALTPEIYEKVFDSTIATPYEVAVDDNYKPPVGLQLDRQIREDTTTAYYSNTDFHFAVQPAQMTEASLDRCQVFKWLEHLTAEDRNLINKLSLDRKFTSSWDGSSDIEQALWMAYSEVRDIIEKLVEVGFKPDQIYVNYFFRYNDGDEEDWESYAEDFCSFANLQESFSLQ